MTRCIACILLHRKKYSASQPLAAGATDNGDKKDQVKFHIDDEETECLIKAPEIVIDPPSKRLSPTSPTDGLSSETAKS